MANFPTIIQHSHVGGYDGGDASLVRGIADGLHQFKVFVVDNRIDGQVGFHTARCTLRGDVAQVGKGEFARGMGAHIQCLNAEIDGVGSSIEGSGQRFAGTGGCHDFYGFAVDINRIHERMD